MDAYPPIEFVDYEAPTAGPKVGPLERLGNLDRLFEEDKKFVGTLKTDTALRQSFVKGLKDGVDSNIDKATFETVDSALKNRLEFAVRQLSRAIDCEQYILDPAEKKRVANDVFAEYNESLELTMKWKSPGSVALYEDNLDLFHYGQLLCKLVGLEGYEHVTTNDTAQLKVESDEEGESPVKAVKRGSKRPADEGYGTRPIQTMFHLSPNW